jgi:hypothetical protein
MKNFDFYFNPSSASSFTGLASLKNSYKFKSPKLKNLKEWLLNQETYTLHKPLIKNFQREKVMVSGIDDLWQVDLVDVSNISRENKGIKFLLTIIDVFSKRAWVLPLKNKTSESILEAFKLVFKERKPKKIQSDKGLEFLNNMVQKFFKENKVHFYTTNSELKASVVERFNRTIKEKMWRYFSFKNNRKYIDILPELVDSYNNTYHRTIKSKPLEVTIKNEDQIWKNIYGYDKTYGNETFVNPKFKIGDKVRISKNKGIFEKGYTPNWTREIFLIDKLYVQNPPTYIIKDLNDEIIDGRFYEQELQKINHKDEIYTIDKIIRKRKKNNQLEYFVSWLGYPKSFNSWIKASDLVKT